MVVDLPGVQGIKRRPAVVLSSDLYHSTRPDLIIGLITSQISSAATQTDCILKDWQAAGLHKASAFRAFLVTLPSGAVSAVIGHTSTGDWQSILICVQSALAK